MTTFIVSNHTVTLGICRNYALLMLVVLVSSLTMPVYWGGLLFIFLGSMGCLAGRRKQGVYTMFAGLVACYWGWSWFDGLIDPNCYRRGVSLTGVVNSLPVSQTVAPGRVVQSFKLTGEITDFDSCGGADTFMIYGVDAGQMIPLGALVAIKGRLMPNSSQWNLGSVPDQAYGLARGIHGRLNASEVTVLEVPLGYLSTLRQQLADALQELGGPPRAVGLLEALVLGTGRGIVRSDWERFRFLGITHAFVVSGLHLSLVFLGVWFISRRLLILVWPYGLLRRDWAVVPALVLVAIYSGLAGFNLPTQRALIMLLVGGVLRLSMRRTSVWRVFLMAALIILVTNYFTILGRSFWLSMGATAVLIWLVSQLSPAAFPHLRGWFLRIVLIQAGMVLFMAPVTLFWFGEMTVAAVIANLLLVPIIGSLLVPLALTGTLCVLLWGNIENLPWQLGIHIGMGVLRGAEVLQQVVPENARFNPFQGIDFHRAEDAAIELAVLDVGQGLSVIFGTPDVAVIYDTGDAPPVGISQAEKVIIPYFNRLGTKEIAIRVISHSDRDHSGGVTDLAEQIPSRINIGFAGRPCRVGEVLYQSREMMVTVFNGPGDSNDGSCVLQVRHERLTILLAGDISATREREMIRYWREKLKADILVLAHHGSHTSTAASFLKWVDPTVAVISAGEANRFDHPRPSVVQRLEQRGVRVMNTAREGGITVTAGPQEIKITALRDGNIPYWLSLP